MKEYQKLKCEYDSQSKDAYKIVNEYSFNDLCFILRNYGEEKFAKQIARAIEKQRRKNTEIRT